MDVRPLLPDLLRPHRAVPRGLGHDHRAGAGDQAAPGRRARDRQRLPPPRGAREHGRDARRHLERPARVRHRRGLEPAGVRRLRHRPAAAARAVRPVRRGASRSSSSCFTETTADFEGKHYQLTDARCEPKPVQRPHPPIVHRRRGREAHAARRRAVGAALERARRRRRRASKRKRDVLRASTATTSGATSPRSRPPPTCASTRTNIDAFVRRSAGVGGRRPRPRHRLPPAAPHARRARAAGGGARSRSPVDPESTTRTTRASTTSEACGYAKTATSTIFIVEGYAAVARTRATSPYQARAVLVLDRKAAPRRAACSTGSAFPLYVAPERVLRTTIGFNLHRGIDRVGRTGRRCPTPESLLDGARRGRGARTAQRPREPRLAVPQRARVRHRRGAARSADRRPALPPLRARVDGPRAARSVRTLRCVARRHRHAAGPRLHASSRSRRRRSAPIDEVADIDVRRRSRSCSAPKAPACPTRRSPSADVRSASRWRRASTRSTSRPQPRSRSTACPG